MKHKGTLAMIAGGIASLSLGAYLKDGNLIHFSLYPLVFSPVEFCLEKAKYASNKISEEFKKLDFAREKYSSALKEYNNLTRIR